MVEFGNSLDPDKEFDVFHGLLDFSLDDCLEEGEIADDWDIGDPLCLGPIPSGILLELPLMSNEDFDFASNSGASEQKQLPKERKLAWAQEFGSFHTKGSVTVLESSESDNAITERNKSKGLRDLDTNSELSTSKWTSNARRRRESRKKLPVAMDFMRNSPRSVDNSLNVSDPAYQIVKKCAHCQSSETALWRDGPLGPKTLCNACGLQYKSGCLFPEYQPLSSPTFVPSQHLNSQRKVAEMRNKAKRLKVEIKIDGAPEQTQLHIENSRSYLKFRSNYINHAGVHLVNNDKSLYGSDHVLLKNGSNPCPPLVKKKKKCALCESTETPEWKTGPLGPRTLCNACGILYQAGLLFPEYQPKASPTSVPSQHSNNDRNLMNSRVKPINDPLAADIKVAGASEQKLLPKQRKLARVKESVSFHTQSPVLVLDSSESDDDAVPSRSRAKRLRDVAINPELSASRQTSNARRSKESRNAMNLMRTSPKNVDNSLNVPDPAYQIASKPHPPLVKKCAHCQSSKTTIWRDGPLGPKTLCNACGLRYKSGSLFPDYRPLSNPTFVPSQHSNSHKKVAKMRNKANQYTAGCLDTEYRPKTSPTFVLSQHSNDYRICMKMRAKAMNDSLTADVKIGGAPELADHTGAGAKSCVSPPSPHKKTSCEEKLFEVPIEYGDDNYDNSNGALLQNASKNVKHVGTKPSFPPPSPCKKTSCDEKLFEMPSEHNDDNSDGALLQNTSDPCPAVIKKCSHCESTKTREWRKGPLGPRTLCNACGLQYQVGRLVPEYRPKASPTFVPGLHSNCPPRLVKIGT